MNLLHAAIAKRYPVPEWCVLYEVRNDAGFNARRSADVVAMNTWPSRGLRIHGMEIKTDRGDWLRELAQPEKSAAIQGFCDHWWLVTDDEDVAKLDEIPERWGWLALRGKVLRVMREAPALEPQPISKGFLAALLRNATKGLIAAATVDEAVEARLDAHVKRHRDHVIMDHEHMTKSYERLRDAVRDFHKASGIDIFNTVNQHAYPRVDATKLGTVVRQVLSSESPYGIDQLEYARRNIQNAAEHVDKILAAVRGLEAKQDETGT